MPEQRTLWCPFSMPLPCGCIPGRAASFCAEAVRLWSEVQAAFPVGWRDERSDEEYAHRLAEYDAHFEVVE